MAMATVTPIAKDRGIQKNIFEQALEKAKTVITGERTTEPEKAKVEPATTQIKNNIQAEKPDTYVKPAQANKAPAEKPADTNTVKELWNKAVKVIQEDVVKSVETTTKKVLGLETNGKPKTEDIKLKLGNTSTVKNADGTDETINEVASADQIKAVQAEVTRNANIILNNATTTADKKPITQKERTYEYLQTGLQTEAEKSKTPNKPSYESNIDLSSSDPKVKQRNEEIKQAWANLEANRKMMESYRESLTKDKDELADITAQETEVDKQLAEIEKLQANLRQSVGSTITLTNGARLTNDEVEKDGTGIKQLSKEELERKGIKESEKLLGKDNAFIEYESKDKDGNPITKQHLVNSKLESGERVTNITTDAQDLNGDGVINEQELPSKDNKPLEKIITSLADNTNPNLYLSSVEFKGDKQIIPPSAENGVGQKYSEFYGSVGEGHFRTLKLSKGSSGSMSVESMGSEEFWKQYQTNSDNLEKIIARTKTVPQKEVIAPKPNSENPKPNNEFPVGRVEAKNNQFTYQMTKNQASQIIELLSSAGNKDELGRAHPIYASNISLQLGGQTNPENVSFTLDDNSHNVLSTMILQNPDKFNDIGGLNPEYKKEPIIPIRNNGSLEYQFNLESAEQAKFTSSLFKMAGHVEYGLKIENNHKDKKPIILDDNSYREYAKARQQNPDLINTYSSLSAEDLTKLKTLKLNQSLEEVNALSKEEKTKIAIAYMLQERNNNLSVIRPQEIIRYLQEGKNLPDFMYQTLKAGIQGK
jgi:hypothetical protein